MTKLVVVEVYLEPAAALVAQSYLRSHGLFAVVLDWHHATNCWYNLFALQGIRLCTTETSLAEAQALLGAHVGSWRPEPLPPIRTVDVIFSGVALLAAGILYPTRRNRYR